MIRFEDYYCEYIGKDNVITENETYIVTASKYREMPLNRKYYYPIICTNYCSKLIYSCSGQYIDIIDRYINDDATMQKEMLHKIFIDRRDFKIRNFIRYSIDEPEYVVNDKRVQVLTTDTIYHTNDIKDKVGCIERKKDIINQGRQFVILDNGKIASTAFISDIYANAGNIVVYTNENYRNQGYGKLVVDSCINWCIDNDILPIYLVEESNISSIKLIESIYRSIKKSREIILSYYDG